MKKVLMFFAVIGLSQTAFADEQVIEIGVTGMVCGFCSAKVEKELKTLPGVKAVSVDLDNKRARIVMADGQLADATAVREIISEAGFTPGDIAQTH